MPLSFVIARYFAYVFIAIAAVWLAAFVALSAAINAGFVYEASWGPANARAVADELAQVGVRGPQDIPTAYRYLVMDANGKTLVTDLEGARLDRASEMARTALTDDTGTPTIEGGGAGLTYAAFSLADGGACALVSEYLPQWVSRDLVDVLPNPQNLMLAAGVAGSAVALVLVARRASRVLVRKMAPLTAAAERVGREELDFAVGHANVREVNDVLDALDAMRASLATSLEARFEAERTQREQVAALAHDLKTPLTVLRANADFIDEVLDDGKTLGEDDRRELAGAARDISAGAKRLDGYVQLLIKASRETASAKKAPVKPADLCSRIVGEAQAVARAGGIALSASVDPALAAAPEAPLDQTGLARAVSNLVANAVQHARAAATVSCALLGKSLIIEIADDGPGFSPAALEHGRERFFTDDASRSSRDGERHYGLGLSTAEAVAHAHGGMLGLANRIADNGTVLGAVTTLTVPLQPER